MPPLAVMGFGLATWNMPILGGATFLFLTNLMAIGISAAVLARLYGFGQRLSPRQTGVQALLIVGTLLAFAVPLGLALRQIAWETLATRQAREAVAERFGEEARVSQLQVDFDASLSACAPWCSRRSLRNGAEGAASRDLAAALGRPVEVGIEQIRIGQADAEAAQLAEARGAAADRTAGRIAERLALVAGVAPEQILVDREHRIARVRAVPLPGATMRAVSIARSPRRGRRAGLDDHAHSTRNGPAGNPADHRSARSRSAGRARNRDMGLSASGNTDRRIGAGSGRRRRDTSCGRRRGPDRRALVRPDAAQLARAGHLNGSGAQPPAQTGLVMLAALWRWRIEAMRASSWRRVAMPTNAAPRSTTSSS